MIMKNRNEKFLNELPMKGGDERVEGVSNSPTAEGNKVQGRDNNDEGVLNGFVGIYNDSERKGVKMKRFHFLKP